MTAKKAIRSLYNGSCTIYEYQQTADKVTRKTVFSEAAVLQDQPCRLSFETKSAASIKEEAAAVSQGIKLFLSPDITVKEGSKIVVTQNGRTETYKNSGKPAVYANHQEIMLVPFEGWA